MSRTAQPHIEQALAEHAERLLAGTGLTLDQALTLTASDPGVHTSSSTTAALLDGWHDAALTPGALLPLPDDQNQNRETQP